MLRNGDFALEVTVFEDGVPPHYRVYPFLKGAPLPPKDVTLTIAVTRLGGKVDRFAFTPDRDHLNGDGVLREPHSFDVTVAVNHAGTRHDWTFASYEGRTAPRSTPGTPAGSQR